MDKLKKKKVQLIFEKIKYEDNKNEEAITEIYKNEDWNRVVPLILDAVDHTKSKEKNYGNYPYFRTSTKGDFLPKLDIPSDILSAYQLKELYGIFNISASNATAYAFMSIYFNNIIGNTIQVI